MDARVPYPSASPLLASLDLIESPLPALKGISYEQEFLH